MAKINYSKLEKDLLSFLQYGIEMASGNPDISVKVYNMTQDIFDHDVKIYDNLDKSVVSVYDQLGWYVSIINSLEQAETFYGKSNPKRAKECISNAIRNAEELPKHQEIAKIAKNKIQDFIKTHS